MAFMSTESSNAPVCRFLCVSRKVTLLRLGCHRGCTLLLCQQSKIIGLQHPSHTLPCNGFNEGLGSGCHTHKTHSCAPKHTTVSSWLLSLFRQADRLSSILKKGGTGDVTTLRDGGTLDNGSVRCSVTSD